MATISKAMRMAREAHVGQTYAGGEYMDHLCDVVSMVWQLGASLPSEERNKLITIAWLHDILEDTDVDVFGLRAAGFSEEIVEAIVALTKEWGYSYPEYIERIINNPLALLVKKADTICNLIQSTKEGSKHRIRKYTKQLQLLSCAL